jgi:glycosyltransferase 2 family protein
MRPRIFSASLGHDRFRRATDVLALIPAVVGLALLIVAYPPSVFELSLDRFFAAVPGWLDPAWRFLYDLLGLWAIVLVIAALAARRYVVAFEGIAAFVLALMIALVSARLALGHWPAFWDSVKGGSGAPHFPAVLLAEAAAVVFTVDGHLIRPLRLVGNWIVGLGSLGVLVAVSATPAGTLAGILVAVTAAATIRLAFGTSAGRPEPDIVAAGLTELGVQADGLTPAERQSAGVFMLNARDVSRRPLLVKVYGRDAYDSQLAAKIWRKVLYQDAGPRLRLTRGQAVEHEALVTFLARDAGVPTRTVVTAGETATGDALIVFRDPGEPLDGSVPGTLDDRLLDRGWRSLGLLHDANIAHLQVDLESVAIIGDDVGLVDLSGATVSPTRDQINTDCAQLLATTAVVAGTDRALRAAVDSLGKEGTAALLPYIQSAALRTPLRNAVKAAEIDLEELRVQAAEKVGAELPEPIKVRRLTWLSVAQIALLVLAATAVISFATTIDWETVRTNLAEAAWGWIGFGFLLAQVARVTQATSSLGSIAADIPFGRVYMKQLATSYLNLAVPSHVARVGVDIRFFQCQGLPGATAITAGVIDSVVSTVVQATLLILLLVFSEASLNLDLNTPSGDSLRLLWILLGFVVVTALLLVLVERIRRAIVDRLRTWLPQMRSGLTALRTPRKLAMLVGGNIATELLFASALGLFARSLGYPISFPDLLVINMSVSLLASFVPVPGGVGVTEFGLTLGLTSAGMPEEAALAAVLLYRVSSFYLPPIWGFFALRWLQKNRYL